MSDYEVPENAVALVGMAGRFPGARDLAAFWRNLRDGVDAVRAYGEAELLALGLDPAVVADPGFIRRAAQPDGIDRFDASFFGISHREAEILDPQQRFLLELAWEALEDAGHAPGAGELVTGVFAGATMSTYLLFNLMPDAALQAEMEPLQLLVANTGDSLATRISYKLDLKGPSYTVQSACSTSLLAVHNACQSLLNGECDLALAGGVSLNMSLLAGYQRRAGSVLSPDGRCRAFDAGAEGILFGGGAGLVVLRRLEDALADGDAIRAVIRGSAVTNDGANKVGYTAPSVEGQAAVIAEALGAAGVEAETISYIEAHGTGTRLGDPIEIQALTRAFRTETARRGFVPMGSVKTNIGHLDVAAGVAGLIKTVLALENRQIPPSLHFETPNPEIDFAASPVFVNTALRDWEPAAGAPRRAGVSSFGFGGTNVHVVLEEAPPRPARTASSEPGWRLLPLSARSERSLAAVTADLAARLRERPDLDLADVAFTLQVGRKGFEHRRLVACRDREEALAALESLDPARVTTALVGTRAGAAPAFPFTGEGGDRAVRLADLGHRWLAGETVDWSSSDLGKGRRVPLPTYPFERESYWIPARGIADAPRLGLPVSAPPGPEGAAPAPPPREADPLLPLGGGAVRAVHARPNLFTPYVEPRDAEETRVAGIWREILGVEPVGAHDNFFQLGGHSLLATQVLARIREAFGIDFPLQHLFSFPTPAELADAVRFLVAEQAAGAAGEAPAPIEPSPLRVLGGPYPLSFSQERIWFLDQLAPGTDAFNIPAATHLRGRLDVPALEWSLNEIVRRHEILRTRFPTDGEGAVQEILPGLVLSLPVADLSGLPEAARAAEERRLALAEAARPFDLVHGSLLRAVLLRLRPDEHLVAFAVHHIAADGWSLGVLQRELARHYRTAVLGEAPLPPLPIQYLDVADWQRRRFQGPVLDDLLAYWRPRLAGLPSLDLKGDRPRPPVQTFRGGFVDFHLPPTLARSLESLAQSQGASLFMVLLAGFQALLRVYAQQDDFAVGALIANRNRAELEGLIGVFINNLVLRADLAGDPEAAELVRRVRSTTVEAYAHQDLPFEKLVEHLQPERDMSRGALVQVMLNFLNFPKIHEELPGLTLESAGVRNDRANFDLTLWMAEAEDGGLVGWLEHNAELFDRATAERMARHLERLYRGLATDPARRVSELSLLDDAERRQVLVEWNRTARDLPVETFPALFRAQAARTPEAAAAFFRGESLTYAELDRRSERLARRLTAVPAVAAQPEPVVALLAERDLDFLTAVVAILKAGAAYLPLDPGQPHTRVLRMLEASAAACLLAGGPRAEGLAGGLPAGSPTAFPLRELLAEGGAMGEAALPPPPLPDQLAYVIFTSGSTGLPKGAMLHHLGLLNHLLSKVESLDLTPADRVAQTAGQTFDVSVWQLLAPLLAGATVVIYPDEVAFDSERLPPALERDRATTVEVVPSLLAAWLDALEAPGAGRPALAALRWLMPTGEALPPELCRRWLAAYPAVPLINAYGPAECCDDVSTHTLREPPAPRVPRVPIGRPVCNLRLYVAGRALAPLPVGVAGELCAGGIGVGRGYRGDPARTAAVFVPDPFSGEAGGRLYRTGDLARILPGGELEFLGRVDHQVKVRGMRVELGEIEAAAMEHPGVRLAAVTLWESPAGRQLAAYVAPQSGGAGAAGLGGADLRAFLRERLPEALVPATFVILDDLPLSPNGKVDRRALPPPGRQERDDLDQGFVPPRTEVEEALAEIWKGILGVPRVGAFDSFFELGGHSLIATRVLSQVREIFEVDLPLRALFEAPILGELALVIEEKVIARIDSLSEEELAQYL